MDDVVSGFLSDAFWKLKPCQGKSPRCFCDIENTLERRTVFETPLAQPSIKFVMRDRFDGGGAERRRIHRDFRRGIAPLRSNGAACVHRPRLTTRIGWLAEN